jgi:hypothetical protein
MSTLKNTRLQLIILYACICVVLTLRINIESTGYMSLDSEFYTKSTTNYLAGKGFVAPITYPFDENTPEAFITVWPIGYPVLIAIVSYLTGFDAFISSKLANAIFLGFVFILLFYWYGSYSLLPACYFCSFNQLEIYSYTWSEGVFLFFLLWLLYLSEKVLSQKSTYLHTVLLIFCLVAMSLLRYAGLIYFFYLSFVTIILFLQNKNSLAKQFTIVISVSSLLIFCYLLNNYFISGGFFGSHPRIFPETESWLSFLKLLSNGLINELFIARKYYWSWDPIFAFLLILQLIVCYYILKNRSNLNLGSLQKNHGLTAILSSFFYLIFIVILRKVSPFDAFDYRILAPFSTPIFIILLGNLRYERVQNENSGLNILIASFFILSLIMNLPKIFILNWFGVAY